FPGPPPPHALHPFPTRRSSDLLARRLIARPNAPLLAPSDGRVEPAGRIARELPWLAAGAGSEPAGHHRRMIYRSNPASGFNASRSEEHTSELQSRFDLVCRLLL